MRTQTNVLLPPFIRDSILSPLCSSCLCTLSNGNDDYASRFVYEQFRLVYCIWKLNGNTSLCPFLSTFRYLPPVISEKEQKRQHRLFLIVWVLYHSCRVMIPHDTIPFFFLFFLGLSEMIVSPLPNGAPKLRSKDLPHRTTCAYFVLIASRETEALAHKKRSGEALCTKGVAQ
mmetsp:Transcript_29712/g.76729  ORF Transcript_29712/g.76729 Transcript_29712/m.76729 type:complete len:173 (-) Transcript_29712:2428-2946(-)